MSNGSQTPQILIVGAGAMGLGAGYHLHLAKAAITFVPHGLGFRSSRHHDS
jgi:cation diffusion facilitator CzcD-associated flavoprotein CzcO